MWFIFHRMRVAGVIMGGMFALIFLIVAIPEISSLQDQGETLAGNLPLVWDKVTGLAVILSVVVGISVLLVAAAAITRMMR